jgi:hypothetical protein
MKTVRTNTKAAAFIREIPGFHRDFGERFCDMFSRRFF